MLPLHGALFTEVFLFLAAFCMFIMCFWLVLSVWQVLGWEGGQKLICFLPRLFFHIVDCCGYSVLEFEFLFLSLLLFSNFVLLGWLPIHLPVLYADGVFSIV
jgi:hypothetical protein